MFCLGAGACAPTGTVWAFGFVWGCYFCLFVFAYRPDGCISFARSADMCQACAAWQHPAERWRHGTATATAVLPGPVFWGQTDMSTVRSDIMSATDEAWETNTESEEGKGELGEASGIR